MSEFRESQVGEGPPTPVRDRELEFLVDFAYLSQEDADLIEETGDYIDSSEQSEAWDRYQEALGKLEKGDRSFIDDSYVEFNEDNDYYGTVTHSDSSVDEPLDVDEPPAVPGGDGESKAGAGEIAVNTAALRTFGENVLKLKDTMLTSLGYVEQVNLAPGGFAMAYKLKSKIQDDLLNDTLGFMKNTANAFVDINDDILRVVRDYDTVEELNELSGNKLGSLMGESFDRVDASSNFGSSGSEDAGGNGGEGDSDSGSDEVESDK